MFDAQHIPYWAHEVAKPTKQPHRIETMLVRIHKLNKDEEEAISELTRRMFATGPTRRTKRDWDERYPGFHRYWHRFYGGQILRQRISSAKARHPVCTNRADGTAMNDVALTRKATVWHTGDLKRLRPKRTGMCGSHEGPGVAVSECPLDWQEIAGSPGSLWRLNRTDGECGRFVDFRTLSEAQREDYVTRALRKRLIKRCTKWQLETFNEDGDPVCFGFASREEAEQERTDGSGETVEEVDGYAATAKLDAWWQQHFTRSLEKCDPNVGRDELAILKLLMEEDLHDGVWWYERYDPDGLSAPRGVIFPTRLKDWERRCEDGALDPSAD